MFRPPPRLRSLALAPTLACALLSACGGDGSSASANHHPNVFPITGMIEGFYGPPYAAEDRLALVDVLAEAGLDHYVYAPKNDPYHRSRWREPYPPDELAAIGELARAATRAGVTLTFAVSPTDMVFTNGADVAALLAKLDAVGAGGVRSFTVSFDDTLPFFSAPGDLLRYGLDLAAAHAELVNGVLAHLRGNDEAAELFFTPMDYNGAIQPYSFRLGELLDPAVPVFWTGPSVYSPAVDAAYMAEVAAALRRPPLLWDNFPVNDALYAYELHLGEYQGRDPALAGVLGGVILNTMIEPRASQVALRQLGTFADDPARFDSERAWRAALEGTAPRSDAFRLFAEQSRASPLGRVDAVELEVKVDAFYDTFESGGPAFELAASELGALFDRFATIRPALEREVRDTRLLAEIEPWIARLEGLGAIGRRGLDAIVAAHASRPDRAAALTVKAMAVESELDPHRMCGDAVARFLSEGADRLAR